MTGLPAPFPASNPHPVRSFSKPVIVGGALESPADTPLEQAHRLTGNTGNLAFSVAIQKSLLNPGAPAFKVHNKGQAAAQGDMAVLPCANFLSEEGNEGLRKRGDVISALGMPVMALGLGAQAPISSDGFKLHDDARAFVEAIVRNRSGSGPNISVRGEFTRKVMELSGFGADIEVLGCPSLFLNTTPQLGRQIQRRFDAGIARVAVGGWSKNIPAALEARLCQVATATGGVYVVQHPKDLVLYAAGRQDLMDPRMARRVHRVLTPALSPSEAKAWALRHARVFFNLADWTAEMAACDFFVGGRIHGTMLAIQSGIPALCVVHDSRTLELCEMMKLPHVRMADLPEGALTPDVLRRLFRFDPEAFDANRIELGRRTLAFMQRNGLEQPLSLLARFVAASTSAAAA